MKKTQKKIFGVLGLFLVLVTTIYAALIPGPAASAATDTNTIVDTIKVRVLDGAPNVTITSPQNDAVISTLDEVISLSYGNTKSYKLIATYLGPNEWEGDEYPSMTIAEAETPEEFGDDVRYSFRPVGEWMGYGKYILTLTGIGLDDSVIEDTIQIEYVAIDASASIDEETNQIYVDLTNNSTEDGVREEDKVEKIIIKIYDENGNEVPGISPVTINDPTTERVDLDFGKYDLPDGKYTIVAQGYNIDGVGLYRPISMTVWYEEILIPSTGTPDTGGFMQNLNISRVDYLVTGLIVFAILGVGGIVLVAKRGKSTSNRRQRK